MYTIDLNHSVWDAPETTGKLYREGGRYCILGKLHIASGGENPTTYKSETEAYTRLRTMLNIESTAEIFCMFDDGLRKEAFNRIMELLRKNPDVKILDGFEPSGSIIKEKVNMGETIKREREKLNLSQRDLANLSGVPKSTISDLENSSHVPKLKTLKKVVDALANL